MSVQLRGRDGGTGQVRGPSLNRISIKLPLLFVIVGIIAPAIGITYFYFVSSSLIAQDSVMFAANQGLLEAAAILIILLIAANAGVLGLLITRSYTHPLQEITQATKELEKGNFAARVNIVTDHELAVLSECFNRSAQSLASMQEERQRLDKAKSEFLSITSHELRTPITPLKAQLQMLQQEFFGPLTPKQRESIDIVIRNADRLDHIIEDFLEVSRLEAARLKFSFRLTNLTDTIQETVRLMQAFADEKHIHITAEVSEMPIIELDPDRVSQVLRNLLHNSVKFSPDNSTITVKAELKKDHILFSVRDQGVGLTPEDQIRIFEPFYQVEKTMNREHGGTGLGLTICRGIIESQRGKIWVESRLHVGSTFHFTLPLIPVYDIQPIKVLFSPKTEIETKILDQFKTVLGPMGTVEYEDLKHKNALGKDDLIEYISDLEEAYILNHDYAEAFRASIHDIYGEATRQQK